MTEERSAVSSKYWALGDQAVQSATNFCTMVFAARYLEIETFAHFSLAYLAVLFASSFHRTWATQPMNVLGQQQPDRLASRVHALWHAHAMLIPAGVLIVAAVSPFAFAEPALVAATSVYLAVFFLQEMQRRYAYTIFKIRQATLVSLAMAFVQMVGLALLVMTEHDSGAEWMLQLALSQLVGVFLGFVLVRPPSSPIESQRQGAVSVLQEHFRHSRWVIASQLVYWASSQLYPFLLAGVGPAQAATFNAGMSILNVANVLRMTLANYLPAHAGRIAARQGTEALSAYTRRALKVIAAAGVVSWLILLAVAAPLVHMLYGDKFEGADDVLRWVALGMLASMLSVVLNAVALVFGSTRNIFVSNLLGAIFSCTAGIYLTFKYGLQGAIWSNVAGYSIPALLQFIHLWPRIRAGH